MKTTPTVRVGVISDSLGLLRSEALAFLQGCERIIHAGDIGNREILTELERIAPVTAVRGNNDKDEWARSLPHSEFILLGSHRCYLIHDRNEMDIDLVAAGVSLVISGHSHVPKVDERDGCLWLNPGSAGLRRFKLPVSIAEVFVADNGLRANLVTLIK